MTDQSHQPIQPRGLYSSAKKPQSTEWSGFLDTIRSVVNCRFVATALAAATLFGFRTLSANAQPATSDANRPFRTLFVTRSLTHERLLPYLETARPEIVQIGNYGAMFHGYADDKKSTGWPMQLPVAGEKAALEFQRKLNGEVHKLGLKVVGHFRLVKVMGHWEEQRGFVEYYNKRWPTDLLGPKPHPQLRELLQRDANGEPIQTGRSGHAQLALCLSSPHTRKMFKQMLKVSVDSGVDGVMTNFNYHFACVCPYCQAAFKSWLGKRLTPQELRDQLGIEDLSKHTFPEIPARIPGYPDVETAKELDWLAMHWGAEHFKRMFDDIFITYGRSLKQDLLVAQWNHLGHVGIGEERMFVPREMWGRGEDYFWYSGGASFVGKNLNLKEGKAGDAWLSCLYVREMSGGKPFVMGKYDQTRMAVSMAEGYATGGLGMGRYMRFENPVGFEVLSRYTQFMHQHRNLYDGAEPFADAALVLPRTSVLNRQPTALDEFRTLGQTLAERQTLIGVVSDEKLTFKRLAHCRAVILPKSLIKQFANNPEIQHFQRAGGAVISVAPERIVEAVRRSGSSIIEAPWTVRATAYKHSDKIILHLVNYAREEGASESNRRGPEAERPKPVKGVPVNFRLPGNHRATGVTLSAPDLKKTVKLPFQSQDGRVAFRVPRLFVYGVIAIDTQTR